MLRTSGRRARPWAQVGGYWQLTKSAQTTLLLVTALCGYSITRPAGGPAQVLAMIGSMGLTIAGCTTLNMVLDHDIDAQMARTAKRPLPAGLLGPVESAIFGGALSVAGLAWSFTLGLPYGVVVAAGFVLDLAVYTLWLKRRTPFSILLGGVAGGMPVLAGRTLALGGVDALGALLALAILLWIPTHILTLGLRYSEDYRRAGVPIWPNVYGATATRRLIVGCNLLTVGALMTAGVLLNLALGWLVLAGGASLAFLLITALSVLRPEGRIDFLLFKIASVYMLVMCALITLGALL
jgi:protoheme IX farnesyltransferase